MLLCFVRLVALGIEHIPMHWPYQHCSSTFDRSGEDRMLGVQLSYAHADERMSSTSLVHTNPVSSNVQRSSPAPKASSVLFTATPPDALQRRTNLRQSSSPAKGTPPPQPSPAPSTPGKWEHPRMEEIIRRQNASNFDQSSVRRILFSAACLMAVSVVPYYIAPM